MKRVLLALALSLALPAASAASINTAYRVVGDPGAGVVQVFDDGQALYVQLRDVTRVPAPFVDGQPAQYVIRGQYIVLPLIPSVELRHGNDVVRVTRAGLPGGAQAQVFRSVDVGRGAARGSLLVGGGLLGPWHAGHAHLVQLGDWQARSREGRRHRPRRS